MRPRRRKFSFEETINASRETWTRFRSTNEYVVPALAFSGEVQTHRVRTGLEPTESGERHDDSRGRNADRRNRGAR